MNKSTVIGALRCALGINALRGALGVTACGVLSLSLLINAPEVQAQAAAKPAKPAAAPQQKPQVPGYYRYMVCDVEVTALYDGYIQLDTKLLKGIQGDDLQNLLAKLFIDSTDGVQTAVNAYLINTGEELVLVDTGAAKAPEAQQGFFSMSRNSVAPYKAAKRFDTFEPTAKLAKTLSVVPSPGHTPGHSSLLIESAGQSLLILGDIVHNYAVQFPRPDVAIEFDTNSDQAIKSRKKIFADAAANRLAVAGAHLPFPGIGHVGTQERGYVWVPASYRPVTNTAR